MRVFSWTVETSLRVGCKMEGDLAWFERQFPHLDRGIVRDVYHSIGSDPQAVMVQLKMLVGHAPPVLH